MSPKIPQSVRRAVVQFPHHETGKPTKPAASLEAFEARGLAQTIASEGRFPVVTRGKSYGQTMLRMQAPQAPFDDAVQFAEVANASIKKGGPSAEDPQAIGVAIDVAEALWNACALDHVRLAKEYGYLEEKDAVEVAAELVDTLSDNIERALRNVDAPALREKFDAFSFQRYFYSTLERLPMGPTSSYHGSGVHTPRTTGSAQELHAAEVNLRSKEGFAPNAESEPFAEFMAFATSLARGLERQIVGRRTSIVADPTTGQEVERLDPASQGFVANLKGVPTFVELRERMAGAEGHSRGQLFSAKGLESLGAAVSQANEQFLSKLEEPGNTPVDIRQAYNSYLAAASAYHDAVSSGQGELSSTERENFGKGALVHQRYVRYLAESTMGLVRNYEGPSYKGPKPCDPLMEQLLPGIYDPDPSKPRKDKYDVRHIEAGRPYAGEEYAKTQAKYFR